MTEIGRMIRDEGIKEGIKEGIVEGEKRGEKKGKAELLIKQLIKKFKCVPNDYKEKIKELSEETLDVIATDIFDIEKVEDIEKYFA